MTSRKAEMVSVNLEWRLASHLLTVYSVQHNDGLRLCCIPMDHHMASEYEDVREGWTLRRHVSGTVFPSSCTRVAHSLTLQTGYGHCHRVSYPNALEISGQSQRRMVLLATRHVGNLVLLRSGRHYHHTMRTSSANAAHRSTHNTPVKAARVHVE